MEAVGVVVTVGLIVAVGATYIYIQTDRQKKVSAHIKGYVKTTDKT